MKRTVSWQSQVIDTVLKAWESCVREEPGYPFQMRSALSELIFLICRNYETSRNPPDPRQLRDSQRMKTMLQFISANYGEALTLERIAASAAISKSECLRCFRNILRTTPIQYLRDFRLQQAADRLRAAPEKVSEIARQCGFLEMSYFSKAFRQKYGCTPVEYRNS